jgi:hypothetical protein
MIARYKRMQKPEKGRFIDIGEYFPSVMQIKVKSIEEQEMEFQLQLAICVQKALIGLMERAPAKYFFTPDGLFFPWGPAAKDMQKFPSYRLSSGMKEAGE